MMTQVMATGKDVVERKADRELESAPVRVGVGWKQDIDGTCERWSVSDPPIAFVEGFADKVEVAVLQVAEATVKELGRRLAGRSHYLTALVEIDLMAAGSESRGGHDAVDSATDDGEVHWYGPEATRMRSK